MKRITMKFMALALLMLAGVAASHAQVAFQTTTAQRPMRQEGLAEASGDITLVVIAPGTVVQNSSIDFIFSTPIATTTNLSVANNILCNASTACDNTTLGISIVGNNTVHLSVTGAAGVQFNTVNTNRITLRGIRVNANAALGVGTVSVAMNATSANSNVNPITFTTASGLVGTLNATLDVLFRAGSTLQTCSVPNQDAQSITQANTGTTSRYIAGRVGVQEKYGAALLTAADELGLAPHPVLAGTLNSTRVTVTLTGIPAGIRVVIPQAVATVAGGNIATVAGAGTGAPASTSSQLYTTGNYTLGLTPVAGTPLFVDQTVAGSPITVTYDVSAENSGVVEAAELFFFFGTYNSASTSSTSSIPTLGGTGSPVQATVSLTPANDGTSAPRFAANSVGPTTIENITDCNTRLLFTWVATVADVETGVAIANTSSDDAAFGSGSSNGATSQNGTCTLTGYPSAGGTPVSFTTATIPAGQTLAFLMSGTTGFSNFTGYVLTVCNFQAAHAFAFITNGRGTVAGPTIAHGYLANVIPVGGRTAESLSN